jgi:hypothetical protein
MPPSSVRDYSGILSANAVQISKALVLKQRVKIGAAVDRRTVGALGAMDVRHCLN